MEEHEEHETLSVQDSHCGRHGAQMSISVVLSVVSTLVVLYVWLGHVFKQVLLNKNMLLLHVRQVLDTSLELLLFTKMHYLHGDKQLVENVMCNKLL